MRTLIRTYFLSSCLLLNACSHIPSTIENAPPRDISYTQAIQYFEKHKNLTVRWGGIVVDLVNQRYQSFMQVLVYPLDSEGRPDLNQPSVGHFIVKSPTFLDPTVYQLDAEVTVSGILESMVEQRSIDNRLFKVPVVLPGVIYLWLNYKSYSYPYYQAAGGYGGYYGNYYHSGGHISYPGFPLQNIQRTQNYYRQRQEQEAHHRLREEQETHERQYQEPESHDRLREEQDSQERQREEQAANERQRQEQESQQRQREEQAANERQRQEQEAQQHQQAEQPAPTPPPKPHEHRKREE